MKEILIGPRDQYTAFPVEVQLNGDLYFLVHPDEGQYSLFSSICPHGGYTVDLIDGELECPLHGWTFESHTGRCHNVPSARLASYDVILKDNQLFALMG